MRKTWLQPMFMVSHCILMLYSSPRLYQHKEDDFSVLIFISDKMFSNSMFTSKERKADNWQVLFVFLLICVFLLFENFVQIKNWNWKYSSLYWYIRRRLYIVQRENKGNENCKKYLDRFIPVQYIYTIHYIIYALQRIQF